MSGAALPASSTGFWAFSPSRNARPNGAGWSKIQRAHDPPGPPPRPGWSMTIFLSFQNGSSKSSNFLGSLSGGTSVVLIRMPLPWIAYTSDGKLMYPEGATLNFEPASDSDGGVKFSVKPRSDRPCVVPVPPG